MLLKAHLLERLNHSFYAENTANFKEHTAKEPNVCHKFIFCFDNSGGYLDRKPYGHNDTYNNLLKTQLFSDLKHVLEKNQLNTDDIMFVKLYDPNLDLPYEWKSLDSSNVNSIINNFEQCTKPAKSDNITSNFLDFYGKIENYCENSVTTLFIYSDFIHDLSPAITKPTQEETIVLNDHKDKITTKLQSLLRRKITIIAHFVQIDEIRADERKVLPFIDTEDSLFLKCTNILESKNKLMPHRIKQTKNLRFFYYDDMDWTNSILWLNFEKTGNHIIDIDKKFTIQDGSYGEYEFSAYRALKGKEVKIKYSGHKAPDSQPRLKIIQDGVHYNVFCEFQSNGTKINIIFLIIWSCFLGIVAGCCIIKKPKEP